MSTAGENDLVNVEEKMVQEVGGHAIPQARLLEPDPDNPCRGR